MLLALSKKTVIDFYLSIIFVFHREEARQAGLCVYVSERLLRVVHMCLYVGALSVCCPLTYDWGSVNTRSMCALFPLRCCCSKSIPGQRTQQSTHSLHCSLIGWKLAGGGKHVFVRLYAVCALV